MKALLGATADHQPWHDMAVRVAGSCLDCSSTPTPEGDTTALAVDAAPACDQGPQAGAGSPEHDDHDALQAELDAMPDHDLGWALSMLTQAVAVLDQSLLHWNGAEIEVLDLLGRVRQQRLLLAQTESLLETRAAKIMAGDVVEWPGGTAERRWGKDRREWKHEELSSAVARTIAATVAVDPATGEVDQSSARVAHEAITAYAATNRPSWRVTALKPLGIAADDFCSSSPGRPTVQVTLGGAA